MAAKVAKILSGMLCYVGGWMGAGVGQRRREKKAEEEALLRREAVKGGVMEEGTRPDTWAVSSQVGHDR